MTVRTRVTSTRTHVLIGFANPYFVCDICKESVPYWHNPGRCGCEDESYNSPCEHPLGITSVCSTWNPVTGCECTNKETHDKE
jgi:hypothetical protein